MLMPYRGASAWSAVCLHFEPKDSSWGQWAGRWDQEQQSHGAMLAAKEQRALVTRSEVQR